MNRVDTEVERSKVKVTMRHIWSEKHVGNFEGRSFRHHSQKSTFLPKA